MQLPGRSHTILTHIVEAYVETGEPIGSKTLSARLGMTLSPATIRNVMAELEELGLLYAPHTSAGRLPTDQALRFFVQGLLETGNISPRERQQLEQQCVGSNRSCEAALEQAASALSGLAACAGLVLAPKAEEPLRHIEFVPLHGNRALVVLVLDSGQVENRIIELPEGCAPSALVEATNYLNAKVIGHTLAEAHRSLADELASQQADLDSRTARLAALGLSVWNGTQPENALIVRGQSRLLQNVAAMDDIHQVQHLFDILEKQQTLMTLLSGLQQAEGVQIFVGADTPLFERSGCALVVAPLKDKQKRVIGAVGVLGPARLPYRRVIPMVDYTAHIVTRLLGKAS
jgi:heat-inducible transcriptional repressor